MNTSDSEPNAYQFTPNASVEDNFRRVLEDQLTNAIERASHPDRQDVHDDVHEIRKRLKQIRAALRLVRDALPEYRRENERYRDIGRKLSDARDAAAMVEAVDHERVELEADLGAEALDEFRARMVAQRDAFVRAAHYEPLLAEVARELLQGLEAVHTLHLNATGFDAMARGIARSYRRGRNLFRSTKIDSSAEHFHAWRKRTKVHRYHLELLLGAEHAWTQSVHELTSLLGHAQDLTILLNAVEDPAVRAALTDARRDVQQQAIDLGAAVYQDKPATVLERLS